MTDPTPEALAQATEIFHKWQEWVCREFNLPKYEQPELIKAYALALTEQARVHAREVQLVKEERLADIRVVREQELAVRQKQAREIEQLKRLLHTMTPTEAYNVMFSKCEEQAREIERLKETACIHDDRWFALFVMEIERATWEAAIAEARMKTCRSNCLHDECAALRGLIEVLCARAAAQGGTDG